MELGRGRCGDLIVIRVNARNKIISRELLSNTELFINNNVSDSEKTIESSRSYVILLPQLNGKENNEIRV